MSERWLEISVAVEADDADDVRSLMARWAGGAVAVEIPAPDGARSIVRAYLPDGPECAVSRFEIQRALWHLGATGAGGLREPAERWLEPEDYLLAWREFYRPLPLGRRHLVVPSWCEVPATDRRVVRMDPGMAFGTGLHPTTQLAVEALEDLVEPGSVIIDVGTGSGILAIVAALLGARRVEAVDIDADAVRTARRNADINGCARVVQVTQGSVGPVAEATARVLVANIVAGVHLRQMSLYRQAVQPGGSVILGGVIDEREAEVADAARAQGLRLRDVRQAQDWRCLILAHDGGAPRFKP